MKLAEDKLAEMKRVTAVRWKEFEAGVSAATARLRKSIDTGNRLIALAPSAQDLNDFQWGIK